MLPTSILTFMDNNAIGVSVYKIVTVNYIALSLKNMNSKMNASQ